MHLLTIAKDPPMTPPRKDIFSWEQAMLLTDLSTPTKILLMVLRTHSNALGQTVWPSHERIMTMTSLSRSAVKQHLKIARDAGWVRVVKLCEVEGKIAEQQGRKPIKRKARGRDWASCAYECCFPDGQNITDMQQGQEVAPICRGPSEDPQGGQEVTPFPNIDGTTHPEHPKGIPPTPKAGDNVDKSGDKKTPQGVVKNDKREEGTGYRVAHHLTDAGWQAARKAADGWDIHKLAATYDKGVSRRGIPKKADKAFPAWCAAYTKGRKP